MPAEKSPLHPGVQHQAAGVGLDLRLQKPVDAAELGLDAGDQLLDLIGLDDVVVAARLQPPHDLVAVPEAGQQENRRVAVAELTAEVKPRPVRQQDVDHCQVRRGVLDPLARLGERPDGRDPVSALLQRHPVVIQDLGHVLDQQDVRRLHGITSFSPNRARFLYYSEWIDRLQASKKAEPAVSSDGCNPPGVMLY